MVNDSHSCKIRLRYALFSLIAGFVNNFILKIIDNAVEKRTRFLGVDANPVGPDNPPGRVRFLGGT